MQRFSSTSHIMLMCMDPNMDLNTAPAVYKSAVLVGATAAEAQRQHHVRSRPNVHTGEHKSVVQYFGRA